MLPPNNSASLSLIVLPLKVRVPKLKKPPPLNALPLRTVKWEMLTVHISTKRKRPGLEADEDRSPASMVALGQFALPRA